MTKKGPSSRKRSSDSAGFGVPVDILAEGTVDAALALLVGRSEKRRSLPQKRMLLRNHLGRGDRWDEWLADLPALCLVAIEALVEVGGAIILDDLEILVAERSGCELTTADSAVELLLDRMLVMPLKTPESDGADAIAVHRGTLPLLEARVRGVSLPAPPEALRAGHGPIASDMKLNRTLAIAGLAAHRRLRFTNAGAPDRTTLKRFAKGLGLASDEVFGLATAALERGYLGALDENLVPRAQRMIAGVTASERNHNLAPWLRTVVDSWFEEGEWFSADALLRACVRGLLDDRSQASQTTEGFQLEGDITGLFDFVEESLVDIDTLEHYRSDGKTWLRASSPPSERQGDGHVTANFEVMLGPAAHPEVVAELALGCELQRVDRVLTFRITPESVRRGRVAGLAPGQLAGALEAVGRHPVPANVLQLVGEWDDASRPTRIARGWFLFIGTELQPALEKGRLAPHLIGSPMAGVLELDPKTPRGLIGEALAEHSIDASIQYPMSEAFAQRESPALEATRTRLGGEDRWDDADWLDDDDRPLHLDFDMGERPWSLAPAGDEGLRARIESARARGFEEELREAQRAGVGDPLVRLPDALAAQFAELAPVLARLDAQASRELTRFARKLAPAERERWGAMREIGLPLAPFLTLKQKWRRRIAHEADSIDELFALSDEAIEKGRSTPEGERLLTGLRTLVSQPDDTNPFALDERLNRSPEPSHGPDSSRADSEIGDFPELDAVELFRRIAHAVESRRPVHCLVESDEGRRVAELRLERIEIQGGRQVVLAKDLHTLQRRVVPMRKIVSIRF